MQSKNKNNNQNRHHQKGLSLLETAIFLPTVLAFLLGSIDVANYFRSYTAVREGAIAGIRCLYPTDAACVSSYAPKTVPVSDLYLSPLFSSYVNYDGLETKLLLPNYQYGPIRATILSSVSYQVDRKQYAAVKPGFRATGWLKTLATAYPNVSGSQPRHASISDVGRLLSYTQSGLSNHLVSCNSLKSNAASDDSRYDSNEVYGKITLQIPPRPDAVTNDPDIGGIDQCIVLQDESSSRASTRSSCRGSDLKKYARLFFKLNGNLHTDSSNRAVGGHLDLFLEYSLDGGASWRGGAQQLTGSTKQSLGGQDFNRENADFYPRGFTAQEVRYDTSDGKGISSITVTDGQDAFEPHGNLYVPWSSSVRITLRMRKAETKTTLCPSGNSIGWNLGQSEFRIAMPQIVSEQIVCSENMARSACSQISRCIPVAVQNPILRSLNGSQVFGAACDRSATTTLASINSSTCFDAPPSIESLIVSSSSNEKVSDYDLVPVIGNAECITNAEVACPSNFGVADPAQYISGRSVIADSLDARKVCPAPHAIAGSERWFEKDINVYDQPITKVMEDCSFDPSSPLSIDLIPVEIQNYKKLLLPTAYPVGESQLDTSDRDPVELKKQSIFNCPAIRMEQRALSEDSEHEFSPEQWLAVRRSVFYGLQHQLGCSAEQQLRDQARQIGISQKSYLSFTKMFPAQVSEYQNSIESVDSCTQIRIDRSLAASNLRKKLTTSPTIDGEILSQCLLRSADGEQNICVSLPAGVKKIEQTGTYSVDPVLARAIASDAIKSFLPSARDGDQCPTGSERDCISISIEDPSVRGEDALLDEQFSMTAVVQQPLLLLGKKTVPVSYTTRRRWEGYN